MRRAWFLFVPVVVAVSVLVACGGSSDRGQAATGDVLDRRGTPFPVAPQRLAHLGIRRVFLLATVHGRAYYRLVRPGRICLGVGAAGKSTGPGQIRCFLPQNPPPIFDFSLFESTRTNPALHLWRFEGLAPDRVAEIAIIGINSKPIARVRVVRGIYYLASPPKVRVRWIVLYSARGRILSRLPL
jgi:hypothetical protein